VFQGGFESGFGRYGFHPGVDHPGADRDVLGPERHQPPVAFLDMPGVFVLDDDGYLLGGGDVVAGLDLDGWRQRVEIPFKLT
jgi:hypothetical protein